MRFTIVFFGQTIIKLHVNSTHTKKNSIMELNWQIEKVRNQKEQGEYQ